MKEGKRKFLKQIDLQKALELASKGREVKALVPAPGNDWEDMQPSTIRKILEGCIFFQNEPAMENPEVDPAVKEWLQDVQAPDNGGETASETAVDVDSGAKRKKVDRGKVMALHNAGWNNRKIAEEMRIHENTVCRVIKEQKEEEIQC